MLASAALYLGLILFVAALGLTIRPIARLRVPTRRRAVLLAATACVVMAAAFYAPASEARVTVPVTRMDDFMPAWQFHEIHTRHVDAPPAVVYAAIGQVRADEILLFRTLTWIRRGGRPLTPGVLNAGTERPIVDVALNGGFILLAADPPRELVLGAIVGAPTLPPPKATAEMIRMPPAGYSVATLNFIVAPDGRGGSIVSTETRVLSADADARRRFAKYWRVIYPGSALIRRMWLRAIERRAATWKP